MVAAFSVPHEWVEAISNLRFPSSVDRRIQELMDRNNEGELTSDEREALAVFVEMSEQLALIRADALLLLGQRP